WVSWGGRASPVGGGPLACGVGARLTGGRAAGRDRPTARHRRYGCGPRAGGRRARLADARHRRPRGATVDREWLAHDAPRSRGPTAARTPWGPAPRSPLPRSGGWIGEGLRSSDPGGRGGRPARIRARSHARSDLWREGIRISPATWNGQRATGGFLAYVCDSCLPAGARTVTTFGDRESGGSGKGTLTGVTRRLML